MPRPLLVHPFGGGSLNGKVVAFSPALPSCWALNSFYVEAPGNSATAGNRCVLGRKGARALVLGYWLVGFSLQWWFLMPPNRFFKMIHIIQCSWQKRHLRQASPPLSTRGNPLEPGVRCRSLHAQAPEPIGAGPPC